MKPKDYRADVDQAIADINFDTHKYQVVFETTMGTMTVDTWPDVAPGHAKNLLGLAKIGFYDGIIAHRIIDGFVVQIGCPQGTGTGGPGYTIPAEFNARLHETGVLSMARTSDPNSAGSQFFLCLDRVPHLDRQYTAFGKLADDASLKVLAAMGKVETDSRDRPKKEVKVMSAKVVATPK